MENENQPASSTYAPGAVKAVIIIIDRDKTDKVEELLREKRLHLHYMFNGMGTAHSEVLKQLGLSGTEKTVCACIVPAPSAGTFMVSAAERLSLTVPGNGIVFIIPLSGISAALSAFLHNENNNGRIENVMGASEELKGESGYSLVVSVIEKGFSEEIMGAARTVGARGGTIINARRSGGEDAVKFFGVTLQAEKEIVTILVQNEHKKALMQAIANKCGLNSKAHGIILSLPVENCYGIHTEKEQ